MEDVVKLATAEHGVRRSQTNPGQRVLNEKTGKTETNPGYQNPQQLKFRNKIPKTRNI